MSIDLPIEYKDKNKTSPVVSVEQEPISAEKKSPQVDHDHHVHKMHNKTAANRAFNLINYLGFGGVANSGMSLWVTYNVMPTAWAKRRVSDLGMFLRPAVSAWSKTKEIFGYKKLSDAVHASHVAESSRSAAELLCMFVAGCSVLIPMQVMENYKKPIVDRIDQLWNRKYYRECERHGVEPQCLPEEHKSEKQTWGKLLMGRIAGMALVLGFDQMTQAFNNGRHAAGKGNLDTLEWNAGAKIHDALPTRWRDRLINFFSRKGAGIDTIQQNVQERLAKTVGKEPVSRMVFAEQTRLFSKEVSLTLIMAGLIFLFTKTKVVGGVLEKIGLKKKEENPASEAVPPAQACSRHLPSILKSSPNQKFSPPSYRLSRH